MKSKSDGLHQASRMVEHAGYCGYTLHHEHGDCEVGEQGLLQLPPELPSGIRASCEAACIACPRCSFVSFSAKYRECSWYRSCDLNALHTDHPFTTVAVRPTAEALPWSTARNMSSESLGWLASTRPGFCMHHRVYVGAGSSFRPVESSKPDGSPPDGMGVTVPCLPYPRPAVWQGQKARHLLCSLTSHAGDCELDNSGVFYLGELPRSWATAAAICLRRCRDCSRCTFLSVSRRACSWHSQCDMGGLFLLPDDWRSGSFRSRQAELPDMQSYLPQWHSGSSESRYPVTAPEPVTRTFEIATQRVYARHKYGFFFQAFDESCSLAGAVQAVRNLYAHAPIYVWTDNLSGGGRNFSKLCAEFGCTWRYSLKPAGYFNCMHESPAYACGLGYLNRVMEAMADCHCTFLISMEDDTVSLSSNASAVTMCQ